MFKSLQSKLFLVMALVCLSVGLTACNSTTPTTEPKQEEKQVEKKEEKATEDKKEEKKDASEKPAENKKEETTTVSITNWEGEWNNLGAYLDEPELQDAFKEVAEREKKTEQEIKDEYIEKRKSDFNGMVVEGNKVTFLDGFKEKGGNVIDEQEYDYVTSHSAKHGNHEFTWDVFKAKNEDAKFPVLLIMPVHGEESLMHFHMRYGNDDKELLEKDGWFPTFIRPESTIQQIYDEIAE